MNDSVLEYLYKQSPDVKVRLANYFSAEVEEFAFLTTKIIETLEQFLSQNPIYDNDRPQHVAFGLMTKGANTLMAGFEVTLTGYLSEPCILFRSALEGFAVAWDIVDNKTRFTNWKTNKFSSTKSITNLKKVSNSFGKTYGFLSNYTVHTSPLNSSPDMLLTEQGSKFKFFGLIPPGAESSCEKEIYFALMSAHICLELTEVVFHNYSLKLETIERIPGKSYFKNKVSARHQQFVDKAYQLSKPSQHRRLG